MHEEKTIANAQRDDAAITVADLISAYEKGKAAGKLPEATQKLRNPLCCVSTRVCGLSAETTGQTPATVTHFLATVSEIPDMDPLLSVYFFSVSLCLCG